MTMQSIKLHVSPRIKQSVSPIHDALAANAAHTRGFAGVRTSFSYKLGFGSRVLRASGGAVNGWRRRDLKSLDMATLGNLCLDIVLNVPSLPPAPRDERQAYMERLAATPPDKKYWEAGGNCNLAFAAARLGLSVTTLGFVGEEIYGNFLLDVIKEEGVDVVGLSEDFDTAKVDNMYETLLCWVLVDPLQSHAFCSHADFSDEPAFSWLHKLSGRAEMAIRQSKILFCNGYGFDELLPNVMVSALVCSIAAGSAVFFDPGPRGRTLFHGNTDQRRALDQFLMLSDALLFTSDEAESLTGIKNPILAGRELLNKGIRVKWVIIKMGAKGSMLITKSSTSCAPAFMVNVVDTVGCGDSYTAAIAYGFLHDMPPMNTLALANAVGAATATGCGAGRNVATMDKILEILRQSNINEDNEFWSNLISTEPAIEEISLLSTARNKGSDGVCLIHVPLQTVISQLIQKLESKHLNQNCCQSKAERVNEATEVDCH